MDTEKTLYIWVILLIYPILSNGMGQKEMLHYSSNNSERSLWEDSFVKLLRLVKLHLDYEHIVVWRDYNHTTFEECSFENFMRHIVGEPHLVFDNDISHNVWSGKLSKKCLILSCWRSYSGVVNFKVIKRFFPFVIGHLMWVQYPVDVGNVCATLDNDINSILLIMDKDSLNVETIHACSQKKVRKEMLSGIGKLFRAGVTEMNGLVIVTESDQLAPRSILYHDENGDLQLEGFVAKCITTFAERYNAKLNIIRPGQMRTGVFYDILLNKTSHGLLDMPTIVTPYNSDRFPNISYSYPVEVMDLCYMIPLPRLMEANAVFTYIIDIHVMIIIIMLLIVYGILFTIGTHKSTKHLTFSNIVLNDKSIRVLLGQSFLMPHKPCLFMQYVCFLLCYTSLIISTTYQAYLQSNLIHPALKKRVETYEDMRDAGLKIIITSQESFFMDYSILSKYSDLFKSMRPYDKFLKLRDSMDTRYVYPVSNTRWEVFNQQQRFFQRTLFYYSSHLCLSKHTLLAVPLRSELPFKALFDQHLLNLRETGLLQYWISDNFYTMVRLKYTTFEDLSTREKFADAFVLNDLKWVWSFFGCCLILSLIVFLGELVYYRNTVKYCGDNKHPRIN